MSFVFWFGSWCYFPFRAFSFLLFCILLLLYLFLFLFVNGHTDSFYHAFFSFALWFFSFSRPHFLACFSLLLSFLLVLLTFFVSTCSSCRQRRTWETQSLEKEDLLLWLVSFRSCGMALSALSTTSVHTYRSGATLWGKSWGLNSHCYHLLTSCSFGTLHVSVWSSAVAVMFYGFPVLLL